MCWDITVSPVGISILYPSFFLLFDHENVVKKVKERSVTTAFMGIGLSLEARSSVSPVFTSYTVSLCYLSEYNGFTCKDLKKWTSA